MVLQLPGTQHLPVVEAATADRWEASNEAFDVPLPVTLRLDSDVVRHFRATGKGWQTRINDILRKAAGL